MTIFISGFLLFLSLCLDLGIVNIATIKPGVERGFIPSLYLGLGAGFGDMIRDNSRDRKDFIYGIGLALASLRLFYGLLQ